ncbi:hypothetical protein RSAG8_04804, partial [Rhizoctonia solani AG-8 WAC10335]
MALLPFWDGGPPSIWTLSESPGNGTDAPLTRWVTCNWFEQISIMNIVHVDT